MIFEFKFKFTLVYRYTKTHW